MKMSIKDVIETMRVYDNPESGLDKDLIKTLKAASLYYGLSASEYIDTLLFLSYPGKKFNKNVHETDGIQEFDYVIRIPIKREGIKFPLMDGAKPDIDIEGLDYSNGHFVSKDGKIFLYPDSRDTVRIKPMYKIRPKNHDSLLKLIPEIKSVANKVYKQLESKGLIMHYRSGWD